MTQISTIQLISVINNLNIHHFFLSVYLMTTINAFLNDFCHNEGKNLRF